MSKIVLLCLVVLLVAVVSDARRRGRGRDEDGSLRVRGRGRPWRRWGANRVGSDDDPADDSALSDDGNIPMRGRRPPNGGHSGRPNRRRPWKLRRKMRRRNRFHRMNNANDTADNDAMTDRRAKWMEMKQRRMSRWHSRMARRGCFCLSPEKLESLKQLIIEQAREDEFPEIIPEEDPDVDDTDDDNDDGEDDVVDETALVPEETFTDTPTIVL